MPLQSLTARGERFRSYSALATMSPGFRASSLTRAIGHAALVAVTSLWLVAVSQSSVQAEVVFGNLGENGDEVITSANSFNTTNPNAGGVRALAMGFTTGSGGMALKIEAITMWLSASPGASRTMTINADAGGRPGQVIATSNPFVFSTLAAEPEKATFTFASLGGSVELDPSTVYWVIPSEATAIRWWRDDELSNPVAFKNSGYTYLSPGTRRKNTATTWTANSSLGFSSNYSLSIIAVPESSTLPLAGIGLVIGGWAARRRAKRQVADHDGFAENETGDEDLSADRMIG